MHLRQILLYLHLVMVAFGQDRPYIKPKIFIDKDGTVYWNRKLPVYLKLSTGIDTGQTVLLNSKISAKYINPFFLDTEGSNFFRTKWAVDPITGKTVEPKQEIVWEVVNDGKPPFSKPSLNSSRSVTRQKKIYFKKSVTITMDGYDAISGLDLIYISVNSAPFEVYKGPITIDQSGNHHIQFFCVDKVGNAEPTQHLYFTIDIKPPKTSYQIKGLQFEDIVPGSSKIVFEAVDDAVGVEKTVFRVDSGAWKLYTDPIVAAQLGEGQHTIEFLSIDFLAEKEDPQTLNLYVDTKAPYVSMEIIGDKYVANGKEFSSGRTRIKLSALDNKAGVKSIWYSINNEPYQIYEKPFYLTGKGGQQKIKYYAIDNVNNKSGNDDGLGNSISMPYLDVTGPSIQHMFIGPEYQARDTIFISSKTKLKIIASDPESGVQKIKYQLQPKTEMDYLLPFSVESDGFKEVDITAYDQVNNLNRKKIGFVVDNQGPDIYPKFSIPAKSSILINGNTLDVYPSDLEIYLAATDNQVGNRRISYAINGGNEKIYEAPIHGFLPNKAYQVRIKAHDWLGNFNTSELNFFISK